MRIARCAACRKRGHNRRTCPRPRYPRQIFRHGRWRDVDEVPSEHSYIGLDEYILKHLGSVPVTSRELHQRVVDDFGLVGERSFLRYLKALRETDRLTVISTQKYSPRFLYVR